MKNYILMKLIEIHFDLDRGASTFMLLPFFILSQNVSSHVGESWKMIEGLDIVGQTIVI